MPYNGFSRSGPKRYELSPSEEWINTRDGLRLLDLLHEEMTGLFGDDVAAELDLLSNDND